ncbi:MAG: sigma-70 family RNA polymerase sigma factor [Polyangiaceae bacterium]|nr:sigma-70 family RNA polymerase sigma factor [Polyangiaceae bacterium]
MAAYPPASALVAHRGILRKVLVACDIRTEDLDDVLSECIAGAWVAVQLGQFRVAPHVDPDAALVRWLIGVAWRQAAHERERAHHRREVLTPEPWAMAAALEVETAFDPEGQLMAREVLRALDRLPADQRDLLLRVAVIGPTAVAAALEVSRTTVAIRLAAARAALEELVGRR